MSLVGALLGSYRITDELSSGGMGTIYRARHELLGRDAAVKVLRADFTADAELVDRFFTEARAATAIRHPGIIEVFDFGYTETGEAYLVMEFLEGQTLHARLKLAKPAGLPEHEAAYLARALANALVAAHGKGIVHRDLKPANIFLVPDHEQPYGVRVKILDFGIAKLVDATGAPLGRSHTVTGTLIGTPRYMAPEQARAASAIDHRADLYSLGCILYEMLVGEAPFPKGGSGEVIAMHLFGEVTPPRERVAVSPEIDAIVMRLLQKEPADRYASAQEVARALAGPAGIVEATPPPFARTPLPPATPTPSVSATHLTAPLTYDNAPTRRDRSLKLPLLAGAVVLVLGGAVAVAIAMQGGPAEPKPPAGPVVAEPVKMEVTPPPALTPVPAVAPPASPPHPAAAHVTPRPHEPVVKVPPKQPACDPRDGAHTAKCAPIETTP